VLPVRAITFDLDDTLWDIWPIIVRAEQRLHDWLTQHYPRIPERFTALDLRQLCGEVAATKPLIAHDRTLLRKEALELAALRAGYDDFQVDAAFSVFFAARNDVVLFEEVLSVLERLARRYTLGALSNGNADIRLVGLDHLFDFALNAVAVGAAKPEPAMFEAACRHLNLPPGQIVHVGDDPYHDVQGAAQVGLRTVWVNRTQREWPGGRRADAEIQTLEELEMLLAGWG
jgi:2-haloalkanoic acid dehalogenase type II